MKKIQNVEELKQIEYDIMLYIRNLCEQNHLTCFLGGGTLLGAIRHKGFIPWDDDVDLMMPRKDYNKILKLIEADSGNYKVSHLGNDQMFFYPYAKVSDKRTALREDCHIPFLGEGVNVEIFPLDGLPRKKYSVKVLFEFAQKYMQIFDALNHTNRYEKAEGFEYHVMVKILRFGSVLLDYFASKCKWNRSDYVACVVGMYGEKEIVPRKTMEEAIAVKFEGEQFYAPRGYHVYLKKHYGDYMKLPPKAKQKTGHSFKAWYLE